MEASTPAGGDAVRLAAAALADCGVQLNLRAYAWVELSALQRLWWDPHLPVFLRLDETTRLAEVVRLLGVEYPADQPAWRLSGRRAEAHSLGDLRAAGPGELWLLSPLPEARRRPNYADFIRVVARLRAPDGCPWDRQQTHASLKRYLLEETYEALEAIDAGDPKKLCEELGDVLLQVALHAQIAAEAGQFTERDVCAAIQEKMIRRHPHVFGEVEVADADQVLRNWERIKQRESPERRSVLDGVPATLPALLKALDVSKRVVRVGFEWPTLARVWAKVREELAELEAELPGGEPERLEAELGDLLFTLVNVARWLHVDPEEALRRTTGRFERRFRELERQAAAAGLEVRELDIGALDDLWERAKAVVG